MSGKAYKSVYVIILTALLFMPAFSGLCVRAEDMGNPPVVISPADCMMKTDGCTVIDDFNRPTVSWESSSGARALDSFSGMPFRPFEGSRSLSFKGSVSKELDGTADSCRFIALTVWSAKDTSISFGVSSQYFEYSSSAIVPGGYWSTVVFDLAHSDAIKKNTTVKKGGVKFRILEFNTGSDQVYIDLVIAFSSVNTLNTMRFVCPFWTATDGARYSNESGVFFPGEKGSIYGSVGIVTGGDRGVEFYVENHSPAVSLTLTSFHSDGTNSSETKYLLEGVDGQSVIFSLPRSDISSLRVSAEGAGDGYIRFLRFSAVSYLSPDRLSGSRGEITSCLISRDGRTLTVGGKIDGCEGCEAYLYSFTRDETVDISRRPSLAQTTVKDREFVFSAEVSSDGTAIHRKYAVFVSAPEGSLAVGGVAYITNPGAVAGNPPDFSERTVKGIGVLPPDYLEYDIGCTIIEINVCELISAGGGISYSRGGAAAVIDSEKTAELDDIMYGLDRRGIAVYFSVSASRTGDPTVDSLVFGETGEQDTDTFRAMCSFLTERYGTPGGISENLAGVIVGEHVNVSENVVLVEESVKKYVSLFRAVFNSVRSINRNIKVFIPLSGTWFAPATSYPADCIPAFLFLRAFSEIITAGGDIPWSIAADIWMPDDNGSTYLKAGNAGNVIRNISASGTAHSFLFTGGKNIDDENDLILMTAEYAEAVFLSGTTLSGIVDGVIPFFSPEYEGTLMFADTKSAALLSYLGEISQDVFRLASDFSAVAGITVTDGQSFDFIPSGIKGRATIFDFENSTNGFAATERGTAVLPGVTLGQESGILSVKFGDIPSWSGVIKKIGAGIDLSVAEYLSVRAAVGSLPEGSDSLPVLIVLRSGGNRALYRGILHSEGFSDIVADIGKLEWRSNISEIGIFIMYENSGAPTLLLSSVDALSLTASENEIINRVVVSQEKPEYPLYKLLIICGAAVLCAAVIAARAFRRRKNI